MANIISVRGLSKEFAAGDKAQSRLLALDGVDFDVHDNEFLTIIGPSGCGKTTLLRILAGLVPYDRGEVVVKDKPVVGPGPDRAMVFQNFALLPWADVLSNVAFGLELRGVPKAEREATALRLVHLVGLQGFERVLPKTLSGGMQQRVGLARALSVDP
jgi:NitT/TauT family transport system ATP-binding protein